MIAYFDTSALVPLLVDEPSSSACRRLWEDADDVVAARLGYVETAAALSQARRLGRLTSRRQRAALRALDELWSQMQIAEVDQLLVERAAQVADEFALRGYDAIHCAAALVLNDETLVAAAGDRQLLTAWHALGVNTYDTNAA
jgi:predicted nucleic acid-binding protein